MTYCVRRIIISCPADSIRRLFPVGSFLRSPHEVPSCTRHQAVVQHGHFKLCHVFSRGQPPIASRLEAYVHKSRVDNSTRTIFPVETSTGWNDCRVIIDPSVRHTGGSKHVFADKIHVL